MANPQGVSIAFNADTYDTNPTWTRLDNPAGYDLVQSWSIRRGRNSEVDRMEGGTATVNLIDTNGTLDPTNSSSPFFGKFDPNKQAAIALYNPVAASWTTIFQGFVSEWLYEMDITEDFATVTLELVDAFALLSTLEMTPGNHGDTVPAGSEGDIYFHGEPEGAQRHVDGRINQALDDVGWPSTWRDIFSGNVTVRGETYARRDGLMNVLYDAADAEFPGPANVYVAKDGTVTFHGRYARFFPTRSQYGIDTWEVGDQATALIDTSTVPIAGLSFRRSRTDVINRALALWKNADSDQLVAALTVEDAVSIAAYGINSVSFENLLTYQGHDDDNNTTSSPTETQLFAQYYVDNYADPQTRITTLRFRPVGVGTRLNPTAAWAFLCGVELNDLIHVTTNHTGGGGFDDDYFVEGITIDADTAGGANFTNVTLELDVSPAIYYSNNPFGSVDGGIPTAILSGTWTLEATAT